MRKFIPFILMIIFPINLIYGEKKFQGFSIGASAGYLNYQTFNPEGFFQINLKMFDRPFEPKVGLSYHPYTTSIRDIDDLSVESVGLFVEGVIYPFHKYFFAGVRWEMININWLTDNAINKLEIASVNVTNVFSGTSFYGVVGVDIPIGKMLSFRLYGMPGLQTYNVSNGDFLTNDYRTFSERTQKFVIQANAGIAIRIFSK